MSRYEYVVLYLGQSPIEDIENQTEEEMNRPGPTRYVSDLLNEFGAKGYHIVEFMFIPFDDNHPSVIMEREVSQ